MGKRASFGAITKPLRDKPRKRPGRHKKNSYKHEKRMGKYRGKGKKDVDNYPLISYIYRKKGKDEIYI